ncbi:CPBP family intramembrane metalloprotease [Bacillus aquiflavi]|uniref:CPBP family intramembrane metalloprotease n=1 Tax=Bacillus aquiflavi TaxID=2672567 RepID=A0A6B3VYH6_9BACI|nr:CPBP family intramembrane glutamic endopeptidase [Bacillus aquiflavi]MBA4537060.1 CPBP family intramembrane metalloprotease [Bacillus aquiflavi]NEY81357.1 CPBP family intramembrane metalloprotease [Bacillus aquiflavi]
MNIILWGLICFILVYEPMIGYWLYQRFKMRVITDPSIRLRYYHILMIGLWLSTLMILIVIANFKLTLKDILITVPNINTEILGTVITYIVIGIVILYTLLLLYYVIGYFISDHVKNQLIFMKQKQVEQITFTEILPVTKREKSTWNQVAWTAGITEEMIYRGFLIFSFTTLFPEWSIWLVLLCSSILFGLAHTYQGLSGVIRTTVFGFVFGMLAVALNSIIPLILLHTLIDYVGKLGNIDE